MVGDGGGVVESASGSLRSERTTDGAPSPAVARSDMGSRTIVFRGGIAVAGVAVPPGGGVRADSATGGEQRAELCRRVYSHAGWGW